MKSAGTDTVGYVEPTPSISTGGPAGLLDAESRDWLAALRASDEEAIARLHALLLRAARFEVSRRRPALPHLRGGDLDDVANQAADDALVNVLRRLDDFRGASRFTTWAYKFAFYEARGEAPEALVAGTRGAARARELERPVERRPAA